MRWAAVQARPVKSLTFAEIRECGSKITRDKMFLLSFYLPKSVT
jgi:hypothetical protein